MDKKKPVTPKDNQPAQANYNTSSKAMLAVIAVAGGAI